MRNRREQDHIIHSVYLINQILVLLIKKLIQIISQLTTRVWSLQIFNITVWLMHSFYLEPIKIFKDLLRH
jgi:hypothetical protein